MGFVNGWHPVPPVQSKYCHNQTETGHSTIIALYTGRHNGKWNKHMKYSTNTFKYAQIRSLDASRQEFTML